ncbi:hypothetical protein WN943_023802 [Citrus x changshan-huyou]
MLCLPKLVFITIMEVSAFLLLLLLFFWLNLCFVLKFALFEFVCKVQLVTEFCRN